MKRLKYRHQGRQSYLVDLLNSSSTLEKSQAMPHGQGVAHVIMDDHAHHLIRQSTLVPAVHDSAEISTASFTVFISFLLDCSQVPMETS